MASNFESIIGMHKKDKRAYQKIAPLDLLKGTVSLDFFRSNWGLCMMA